MKMIKLQEVLRMWRAFPPSAVRRPCSRKQAGESELRAFLWRRQNGAHAQHCIPFEG